MRLCWWSRNKLDLASIVVDWRRYDGFCVGVVERGDGVRERGEALVFYEYFCKVFSFCVPSVRVTWLFIGD